jgi:hypothetical protein
VLHRTEFKPPPAFRPGITLFEVVLALAIFVGSFLAISEAFQTGSRALMLAERTSEAAIRCDQQMDKLLAGIIPLDSASQTEFEDDPEWAWTLILAGTETPGLMRAEMTVEHVNPREGSNARVKLVRYLRDPQIYLDAAAAKAAAEEAQQ